MKKTGYSETNRCDYCGETKHWRLFIMGTLTKKVECKDCYDKKMHPAKEEKKVMTTDELLNVVFGEIQP